MNALSTISARQILDQAIEQIRRDVKLSDEEERIVRDSAHRATELGLRYASATNEQKHAIEHEIKAIKATIVSIGEAKAATALEALSETLNRIFLKGIDMVLDRLIGPDSK